MIAVILNFLGVFTISWILVYFASRPRQRWFDEQDRLREENRYIDNKHLIFKRDTKDVV